MVAALNRAPLALAVLAICMLVSACATSPMDTSTVSSQMTPSQAVNAIAEARGERIQWGGQIVSTVNGANGTLIEVLSYPLLNDGFPNTNRQSSGRFVLEYGSFLEPTDFAPGRFVTVVGTVESLTTTSIQSVETHVPLVVPEQLKLWDRDGEGDRNPHFGFGLGIGIGF